MSLLVTGGNDWLAVAMRNADRSPVNLAPVNLAPVNLAGASGVEPLWEA